MTSRADTIEPRFSGNPAPGWRALGWALLGALAAFLVNNILVIGFGTAHLSSLFTECLGAAWVPLAAKIDDHFQKALREIGGSINSLEGTFLRQRNRVLGIG